MNSLQQTSSVKLSLTSYNNSEEAFHTTLHHQGSKNRPQLEGFISGVFEDYYNARVANFYPHLFGVYDANENPYAAIGYRLASEQGLFLEQYFDQPIEHILSSIRRNQAKSAGLNRNHIAEIGNLASTNPLACRKLIQLLTLYFHNSGLRWIIFTATRTVQIVFKRLRFQSYVLGSATLDAVAPEDRPSWGSYYDYSPTVIAVPLAQNISQISKLYHLSQLQH